MTTTRLRPTPCRVIEPPGAEAVYEVAPESCGAARHFVEGWCRAAGLPGEAAQDVGLIVDELTANALHGEGRTVRVAIGPAVVGGRAAVGVQVADDGTWSDPAARDSADADADGLAESGRGLAVVAELADVLQVVPGAAGTTSWACVRI